MSAPRDTVTVRVPGSTSNCGAGFDSLGLALSLYNRVSLRRAAGIAAQAERPADARAQEMVAKTAAVFFAAAGRAPSGFFYRIEGEVPPARGLGSSVTVIAGVLAGLDALHGTDFSRHRLVALATEIEGHPDNASAGILGGFTVSRCDPATGAYLDTVRIPVSAELAFAPPEQADSESATTAAAAAKPAARARLLITGSSSAGCRPGGAPGLASR